MNEMPLKIDLHVHTCYSYDSNTSLKEVLKYSKFRGLNGVAITDHGTVKGALKLQRICKNTDFIVIPGSEIKIMGGHLLALNIEENINPKTEFIEIIEKIHELGGIAVLSHPFSIFKGASRKLLTSIRIFDAIETVNASAVPFNLSSFFGRKYAATYSIPETAGSDAHTPDIIGLAYSIIDAESSSENIIEAVRKGNTKVYGRGVPIYLRIKKFIKNQ